MRGRRRAGHSPQNNGCVTAVPLHCNSEYVDDCAVLVLVVDRKRFWELGGSKMGDAMGIKKPEEEEDEKAAQAIQLGKEKEEAAAAEGKGEEDEGAGVDYRQSSKYDTVPLCACWQSRARGRRGIALPYRLRSPRLVTAHCFIAVCGSRTGTGLRTT